MKKMKLKRLLNDVDVLEIHGTSRVEISNVAYDSRKVSEGTLFVAIPGLKHDGHDFIPEVSKRGAIAVVGEKRKESLPDNVPSKLTYVRVSQSRRALARIANSFYDYPSRKLVLVGITGTNGKTTTSFLLESILKAWNKTTGVIGTINYRYAGIEEKAPVTTPESLDLQCILDRMVSRGVTHAVMEVSSHALDLQRVHGCDFDAAIFTNLSQDHLDYHDNLDSYFECKLKLFTEHLAVSRSNKPVAVVNIDDSYGCKIPDSHSYRTITYSLKTGADIFPGHCEIGTDGIRATLVTPIGEIEVRSRLLGRLNLYNIMAATGGAVGLGVPARVIEEGLEKVSSVSGRMESVPNDLGIGVIVDYAHTPDAMEKALECLKEITAGKLIVVFGCGGDRDRTKRPLMGKVAANYGDIVIVTSDNPRTEDPLDIIEDIRVGLDSAGCRFVENSEEAASSTRSYVVEPDRRRAIKMALEMACPGDVVFVGGKGHEDYQIIGNRRIHFDDREEIIKALNCMKCRTQSATEMSAAGSL